MQPTRVLQGLKYRKLRLTTKDTNKGFYKGNRTGSMGTHTSYGTYKIDYSKVRTYVCPDLSTFKVGLSSFLSGLWTGIGWIGMGRDVVGWGHGVREKHGTEKKGIGETEQREEDTVGTRKGFANKTNNNS